MTLVHFSLAIALLAAPATPEPHAAKPASPAPMVVSVQWLAQHYKDKDVVVLSTGSLSSYFREHIPGARFLDESQVSAPASTSPSSLALELPTPAAGRSELEALGISDDSHVVIVFAGNAFTSATRIVHTMNYLGLGDNVSFLDGGMTAWQQAGQPVTDDATPKPKRGSLRDRPVTDVTVTGDWVASHLHAPGFALLDARGGNGYDGIGGPGHIPGAISFNAGNLIDDTGHLTDKATLEQRLRAAGVMPGDTLIAYCQVGEVATAVVFAARELGRSIKLYDGSMQDWSARKDATYEKKNTTSH